MTATVLDFPSIHAHPAPTVTLGEVDPPLLKLQINIEQPVMEKLVDVAFDADCSPERMAEAFIVWALAAIANKSPSEFYESLVSTL